GVSPMLDVPRFKAHLHVEELAGEGVFLLSEMGPTLLRGRCYELIAPLLNGRRSADDIVDQLDGRLGAAEVYHALHQLDQKGHLAEAKRDRRNGAEAYWHIQDIDPGDATQRLQETTVTVTSLA